MSEKSATSVSNGAHWLALIALFAISLGLWHYFDVPLKKTVGIAASLLLLYTFYLLYQFVQLRKQAQMETHAALARLRAQERELYGYAKASELDLPEAPPVHALSDSSEPKLRPLKLKERSWALVGILMFSVFGYAASTAAFHDISLGVLTYKKKGYPPATITITAAENAMEFYLRTAFVGSLGIFMLSLSIAALLLLPALLLPSIDVAYRTKARPFIKWIVYLALPFGLIFVLLLILLPLVL